MHRRTLLAGVGATVSSVLAGCLADGSEPGDPETAGSDGPETSPKPVDVPDQGNRTVTGEWSVEPAAWPEFGFDVANANFAPDVAGPSADTSSDPGLAWRYDAGTPTLNSSPVLGDGVAYVLGTGGTGTVHAIEVETGAQLWSFEPAGFASGAPALHDGALYFGTWERRCYAIDAETGEPLWQRDVGHRMLDSSPAVADVDGTDAEAGESGGEGADAGAGDATGDEAAAAANSSSGADGPTVFLGTRGDGPLRVGGPEDREGYDTCALLAFDAASGDLAWRFTDFPDGAEIGSSPAVADGLVFVAVADGLYALGAASGELQWSRELPTRQDVSPAVADGVVYYPGPSREDDGPPSQLRALDAATGESLWTADVDDQEVGAAPAIADGTVYVAASSVRTCLTGGNAQCSGVTRGRLYAFDAESGEREWRTEIETDARSAPAVANGTVYVGCDGGVSAVTTDGKRAWRLDFRSEEGEDLYVDSSPALWDGYLFLGASDGLLRAIR